MKRHTAGAIAQVAYVCVIAVTSYYVTPWVWLGILALKTVECGCEECQNIGDEN